MSVYNLTHPVTHPPLLPSTCSPLSPTYAPLPPTCSPLPKDAERELLTELVYINEEDEYQEKLQEYMTGIRDQSKLTYFQEHILQKLELMAKAKIQAFCRYNTYSNQSVECNNSAFGSKELREQFIPHALVMFQKLQLQRCVENLRCMYKEKHDPRGNGITSLKSERTLALRATRAHYQHEKWTCSCTVCNLGTCYDIQHIENHRKYRIIPGNKSCHRIRQANGETPVRDCCTEYQHSGLPCFHFFIVAAKYAGFHLAEYVHDWQKLDVGIRLMLAALALEDTIPKSESELETLISESPLNKFTNTTYTRVADLEHDTILPPPSRGKFQRKRKLEKGGERDEGDPHSSQIVSQFQCSRCKQKGHKRNYCPNYVDQFGIKMDKEKYDKMVATIYPTPPKDQENNWERWMHQDIITRNIKAPTSRQDTTTSLNLTASTGSITTNNTGMFSGLGNHNTQHEHLRTVFRDHILPVMTQHNLTSRDLAEVSQEVIKDLERSELVATATVTTNHDWCATVKARIVQVPIEQTNPFGLACCLARGILGLVVQDVTGNAKAKGFRPGDLIFKVGKYTAYHPGDKHHDESGPGFTAWSKAIAHAQATNATFMKILVTPYPHPGRRLDNEVFQRLPPISALLQPITQRNPKHHVNV